MRKLMINRLKKLTILTLITMLFTVGIVIQAEPPTPVGGNYYLSDFDSREEAIDAANELNEQIYGEGVVLLKNENNALPLANGARISLFGKNSGNILSSGSGSSSGTGARMINMHNALRNAGFVLNQSLINFYNDNALSGSGRGQAPANATMPAGYNTGETPVSNYTEQVESSYNDFNDAAVVVFQRIGGEGFDLPRTMTWNGIDYRTWSTAHVVPGARSGTDHYLQLDKNESDLLKYLGDKFDKVIVLLNTGSQFEVGFLDDPTHYGYHQNIKAGLWMGYPGGTGLNALAKILKGEINPSGKTPDTYARDFKKDPTWMNFGNNLTNFGNQYENLPSTSGHGGGGYRNNYVYYKEGIYVGYRYYETRGFVDGDGWYQQHVVYPFGYGLSYTTFNQEIIESTPLADTTLTAEGTINLTVRVTNTGDVAGKETVQIYYTAPYIHAQIEKSHVVLGAIEKTNIIEPGAFEDVEISIKVRDMASYDYNDANENGFKGYELDQGEYTIRIMRDAHRDYDVIKYNISENIQYPTSEETNKPIENRFDDVSSEITTYLSRSDFEGTFPTTALKVTAPQHIIDGVETWFSNNPSDSGQPYYYSEMPTLGNDTGNIHLSQLIGKAYEDPLWDAFLNQLSLNTLRALAGNGSYASGINNPTLGIQRVVNADSPAGWVSWTPGTNGATRYTLYASDAILAATFNKSLAYEKGILIGNEALYGDGGSHSKYPGWYAPAVNIHRSPFGGRNFEYFSEDGYLSGILAAEIVKGALEKGVFSYVKHFGVNEQEIYRVGLMTWASEQSMREIYLKGFELTVKVGKTRGIMSALNRIGTTWTGGSYPLLTSVLRDEWGFKGMVVTDSYLGGFSNVNQMIRAGGDLALGGAAGSITYEPNSATTIQNLRRASHNLLYAHANSMAMNTGYSTLPPAMSPYVGSLIDVGIYDVEYSADLATVTLNKELLGDDVDDSMITYTLKAGSTLPLGLTLSLDGKISGIPKEEVTTHKFVVEAKYLTYRREATFTISIISSGGAIIFPSQVFETKYIGKALEIDISSAYIFMPDATQTDIENFPPITYALKNGHALPDGLRLSKAGVISGIPRKEIMEYEFTILAQALGYRDTEATFNITIFNEMVFVTKLLLTGRFGTSYLDQVEPANTTHEVTYTLALDSTLPRGLTLTKGGFIIGIPTQVAHDHAFVVVASSPYTVPVETEYKISVGIAYNPLEIPHAKVNDEYETSINTAQGSRNITYALKEGNTLPEGLSISKEGVLSGTPVEAGNYKFSVIAFDETYGQDEIILNLFVEAIPQKTDNQTPIIVISIVLGVGAIAGVAFFFIKKKF